ncbi:MAG: DUF4855 domain-containing protein [Clostridia bacterium]|nr:DUF4855 domain-containing protein [Clostridia bacterium]
MSKRILSGILSIGLLLSVMCISGFAAETNLAAGKSYTVEYDSKIDNAFPARAYKGESALTDGKLATRASYSDPAFLPLYRGTAVSVTIDLGEECAVSSVELRSLQMKSAGIQCARYVHVAVSTDGKAFGTVGSVYDAKSVTSATAGIITHAVTLDQSYTARYVKVTFSCDVYIYCDEIFVYGTKGASGAAAKIDEPVASAGFAGGIDGIENIVLMYTVGNYTQQTLKPYFAYVDKDGNASDIMFESMLFLPSGASGFDYSTSKGWNDYTDNLFGASKSINLTALNGLVGSMREELKLDKDYRYPVFLSVPYLELGNQSIDGIVPNTLENRLTFIRNYIDLLIKRFEDSEFANLELKGFYWHQESVGYTSSEHEVDFIKGFNDYVHSKGYKSIWIPYYCAPGFETAVELGFDCATLQSGYAFPRSGDALKEIGDVLPGAVDDSAAQAKKYGLGMEFELSIGATEMFNRFYKYLHTGYSSGCMDGGMMMLYQGVDDIYRCAGHQPGSEQRKIYDLLYLYIHDRFTSNAPVVDIEDKLIVIKTETRYSNFISISDEDSAKSSWKIVNAESTEGLNYVLEGEGFFLVNTKGTKPGEYKITFAVNDGYNTSEAATLHFLVIDRELPETVLTLDSAIEVYAKLDRTSSTHSIPAGTEIESIRLDDQWCYVSAKIDGEEVNGFLYDPAPEAGDASNTESSTIPETNGTGFPIWIVVIVGVIACLVIVVLILLKNKKQNTK